MSDIFDFFKENESKLHEAPPEQAWRKLENRLEKRRRERKKIRFLQLGSVLLILILMLLLMAAILVLYFMKLEGN